MLRLNIGISKKIGEANYGSRGASVSLELEADSALAGDPDRLKERIRQLFTMAKASVDEELNGQASHAENGSGQTNGIRRDATRKATASQVRAILVIADRQKIDLTKLLREHFGIDQANELSITEASKLIDDLKASSNGAGGRR